MTRRFVVFIELLLSSLLSLCLHEKSYLCVVLRVHHNNKISMPVTDATKLCGLGKQKVFFRVESYSREQIINI